MVGNAPQSKQSGVKLGGIEAVSGAGFEELAVARQILVIASVQGVVAALGLATRIQVLTLSPELQSEEGVLAPGHGRIHVNLVLRGAQVGDPLASSRAQVNL